MAGEIIGFEDQDRNQQVRAAAQDLSPDSPFIFTLDSSNFSSLFSSASGSVDRCSFASELHDHDSLVSSDVFQHLAGYEYRETFLGGPDPDPDPDSDPNKTTVLKPSQLRRKRDKAKVQKEDSSEAAETDNENLGIDSARNSFSKALKECQDRRSRSEALLRKADRPRPASLDLNNSVINVINSSPRFGTVKKNSVMARKTGMFPSPGTPNYQHAGVGIQKGWSSERVPLHTNANRRNTYAALLPLSNGRTLPSKWEDAERWIFSPVSVDSAARASLQQPQRRPKSKSGPLGPPGVAYYSLYSPTVPMLEGGNVGSSIAGSPLSAGVVSVDKISFPCGGDKGGSGTFSAHAEPCIARSVSVHGCSELVCLPSFLEPQVENIEGVKDAATDISRTVSRRDMATQMTPESSANSSPRRMPSFSSSTPSALPLVELQSVHSSKPEVRDVQVDELVSVSKWSKKQRGRASSKGSGNADDWRRKALEIRSSGWEISDTTKSISKLKREEAKITAWENLQKAKAEAAIRKLEMKLEKKRLSSMDKIMNKLKLAQRKAQEMRSSVLANQSHQVAATSQKVVSFRMTRQMGSLSGCFTCHAF